MIALLLTFTAFLGFIACDGTADSKPPSDLPTREITVRADGGAEEHLTIELATTPQQRQKGLMFRSSMPEDHGMLFLFPRQQGEGAGFWMHNTYIPLTIAYLDVDGRVVAMKDGQPLDDTILRPGVPYSAVLEVNQGWFERHGMGIGSIVELPTDAPTPQ